MSTNYLNHLASHQKVDVEINKNFKKENMIKRSLYLMKKKSFFSFALLLAMILGNFTAAQGQNIGDYQSAPVTGGLGTFYWQDLNSWQKWDGSNWITPTLADGWPGQYAGTGDVTILSNHIITIASAGITTQPIGTLTISSGARLTLNGGNTMTTFDIKTLLIYIEPNPITGVLAFIPKAKLVLPLNAVIVVWAGGFVWNSQNCEIWIGGVLFGIGQGGGQFENVYKFNDFMASGGSLDAQPSSNSPICDGFDISLSGSAGGAIGKTEPNGSVDGVNYSWTITGPNGFSVTTTEQNYTIVNPAPGLYYATLSVLTYIIATPYTNAETIEVVVNSLPEPTISGKNPVSNFEENVIYATETGKTDYVWAVDGPDGTSGGVNTAENYSISWGGIGTGTISLFYTDENGCKSVPYYYTVDIVMKQSDAAASWNLSDTWSPAGVPTLKQEILINDAVVIDGATAAECNNMTIDAGGSIVINPGNSLTVLSTLTNNVGSPALVIQSDATGTGSLIHNTDGVNARVRQHLTENEWHYVTSPISTALSGVFLGIYLKPFNEPVDEWGSYIVSTTEPLDVMKGYAAWAVNPTTVSFVGAMNNGPQSIGVTRRDYNPGLGEDGGWNLVGNPYPSAVDWNVTTGWDKTSVDNTIYFWEGVGGEFGSGNYHYYVGAGGSTDLPPEYANDGSSMIPAMQAFFVHASGNGNLVVNNGARVHDAQPYWKSSEVVDIPVIRLAATSEESGHTDETVLRFHPVATRNHDGQYDALKLDGYLVPQLYTITEAQEKLAINTLPNYFNGTVIPLGFIAPSDGQYTISLTQFDNMKPGFDLYLEDLLHDTMHKLSATQSHTFSSSSMDDPNRFMLHFVSNKYFYSKNGEDLITIYSHEKSVYVIIDEAARTNIAIFNLMGQKIAEYSTSEQGLFKIDLNCEPGYYVVRSKSGNEVVSEKVMIR